MADTQDSRPTHRDPPSGNGSEEALLAEIARNGDGEVVLSLNGELALDTADRFRSALEQIEADRPAAQLVVDLSGLSFMDSTGIRGLLKLREAAQREPFELVLVRGAPSVHRVLEITQLVQSFTIVDDHPALG